MATRDSTRTAKKEAVQKLNGLITRVCDLVDLVDLMKTGDAKIDEAALTRLARLDVLDFGKDLETALLDLGLLDTRGGGTFIEINEKSAEVNHG